MNKESESLQPSTIFPGKRLALVVGTNQTATLVPPPLAAAEADAEAMAEVLQQICGFELFRPPLLGKEAESAAVRKAVLQLARDRGPEDVILLFFSGHGIQAYDKLRGEIRNTYLGTADFETRDVEDDDEGLHISLHWLRDRLFLGCDAGQVVIILDCCYAEDMRTGSDHVLDDLLKKFAYYFEIPGAEAGKRQSGLRAALLATGYDQTAEEQGKHGKMTDLILQGLRGKALTLIGEKGEISLSRLAEHLVRQLSPKQKPAIFASNATGQECILASYPDLVPLAYPPRTVPDRPTTYIPFQRDVFFQGRSADFERLEQLLNGKDIPATPAYPGRVGITGLGGVGKTRLAVELAYRFIDQQRYSGGIFWTQMKGTLRSDWEEQFATLAVETSYLPPDDNPASNENKTRRAKHLLRYLADHPDALLILDNLEDPTLITNLIPAIVGKDMRCAILYTSRIQATLPGTVTHPVSPLPPEIALKLLLQTTRPALLAKGLEDSQKAELVAAQNICQRVGYLPIALIFHRNLLAKDLQLSLAHLYDDLRNKGMQALTSLAEDPTTTFSLSWDRIQHSEEESRLFLLASCFAEAAPIPLWLLGLAAGLGEQNTILAPLGRARLHLQELSLFEELSGQLVRLHPLVRDFARNVLKEPVQHGEQLLEEARQRLVDVCTLQWLEQRARSEGYWRLLEHIRAMRAYCDLLVPDEKPAVPTFIHTLERWLDRESYLLAWDEWWPGKFPWLFYQQLFNRAVETGYQLPTAVEGSQPPLWVKQIASAQADDHALLRLFKGHERAVTGVAFSHDGALVLTGSNDGTACLWDQASGRMLARLHIPGRNNSITSVAFSPDSRLVLLGCWDHTARLWEWEQAQELATFQGHTGRVRSVAFSLDGQYILTGANDRTARLWDRQSGQELVRFQGHSDNVTCVAFAPDGQRIATCSSDKTARVWDRQSGHELARCQGHTDQIMGVAFSLEGQLLLTGSADKTARLWHWPLAYEQARLQGYTGEVWCVAFSQDGNVLLTGCDDGTILLWDQEGEHVLARLQGHTSAVRSVAFSPDGTQVLAGSGDGSARLWEWTQVGKESTWLREWANSRKHDGLVTSVAFSPDGNYLLTGSRDRSVGLWNQKGTEWQQERVQGHTGWVTCVSFSPDGTQMLTGSGDGTARLWDRERARELRHVRLPETNAWIHCVAFAPDGLQFLAGSSEGTIRLWDSQTLSELACLQGHSGRVTSAVYSQDGRLILTGSYDRSVRLWDRNTGHEIACLDAFTSRVTSVAISPDGQRFLTGSVDGTAHLWDRATLTELASLRGQSNELRLTAFAPDGHIALTCDEDGRVFFWQISPGAYGILLGLYVAHYEIGAIYWTGDRQLRLADTGGSGGKPHIYELALKGMQEKGNSHLR